MEKERKLTEAEQKRLEMFMETEEKLIGEGYTENLLTVDLTKANILSVAVLFLTAAAFTFIFILINGKEPFAQMRRLLSPALIAAFLVLTVVHELIHGLTWTVCSKGTFADIAFGIDMKHLAPYCCCRVPLSKKSHLTGTLMPLILLGIVPFVISLITASVSLLAISVLMTDAATGDIMIALKVARYRMKGEELLVIDHPVEAGCAVFER